ncbi:hypothetical protein [Achromobacter sp.]
MDTGVSLKWVATGQGRWRL